MKKLFTTLVILFLIAVLGVSFYRLYYVKYSYTEDRADLNAYYGVESEDDFPVILQDELSEYRAVRIDGEIYMDVRDVKKLINDRFYLGAQDGIVCYCLPDRRITVREGESSWTDSKGGSGDEDYMILVQRGDDQYFISLDFVRQYSNFSFEVFTEPNRVVMYTQWGERNEADVKGASKLRTSGGVKSEIVADVPSGSRVVVLDQMDTWSKVMTQDGMIGYVENRKLGPVQTVATQPVTDYEEPEFTHKSMDGIVNLAWHGIAGAAGNQTLQDRIAGTKAVNVVAPTWFVVLNEDGAMESRCTQDYVDAVHDMGKHVWAVLDNFNGPGGLQQSFLASEEARKRLIDTVMDEVLSHGIDGINVDFEGIAAENGDDYIEFVRELSIRCRDEDIFLSVDNYVPYNFNDYYRLDEQGTFTDYVVIMGYDEHYAGSQEPGSVASIDYVTYGIKEALKEVPAQRLINGIPFYTRVWRTAADGVTSEAYGMREARQFIENHGMTMEWDEADGQYYAESSEDDATYQIWVEDKESIERKLEVMKEYHIAGVAEWALGLETADVWDVIEAYVKSGD